MKCENVKTELPGLLFGEVSQDERERLLAHIAQCEECRREWGELKATEAIMLDWKEEEPPRDLVFVAERKEPAWKKVFNYVLAPGVPRWGFAAAALIIALAVAKPSFTVKDGSFNFAFGGAPVPPRLSGVDNSALQSALASERQQTLQMVSELLQANNEEMRRDYTLTLVAFAQDLDRRRSSDMQLFQTGLNDVMQRSTEASIAQTNLFLEDLLKKASLNNGEEQR